MGESKQSENGDHHHHQQEHYVASDGKEINEDMLHAAEHHKGRSSAFSHEKEPVLQDAKEHTVHPQSNTKSFIGMAIVVAISIFTCPQPIQPIGEPTIQHVWYYGWITAVSTGLGVLPLIFVPSLDKFWIGVSNAIAAGMMIAASYSLVMEGCQFSDEAHDNSEISSTVRTLIGVGLGLAFILITKKFLDGHEDLKVGELSAADAKKMILIMFVMTLHSFSEGVGIGVSFGGTHGKDLGIFISASLAAHNVPEGLAVAIVLLPRKITKLNISLWCMMTSLPQPLMAVPAYLFVHHFIPILPVGLGFAGGAMAWVAFGELLLEAFEDTENMITTGMISTLSLGVMMAFQNLMHD